jgi:hypothetical protein
MPTAKRTVQWLTTEQAGALLGIKSIAVIWAIRRGRLKAEWSEALNRYMLRSDDVAYYHTHRRGGSSHRRKASPLDG